MSCSRAITPSIENTPSVAIRRTRQRAASLQPRLQLVEVVVRVAKALRLAQADAVDDAGVVERVADHRVLLAEQRLEQPAVRVEARRIEDRVLGAEEAAESLLELLVDRLRAADEAHRGHAVAVAVERQARRFAHARVIGEAEVVVGAEVDHFLAAGDAHRGALRRRQDAFGLVKALLAQLLGVVTQAVEEIAFHGLGFRRESRELCHWRRGAGPTCRPRAPRRASPRRQTHTACSEMALERIGGRTLTYIILSSWPGRARIAIKRSIRKAIFDRPSIQFCCVALKRYCCAAATPFRIRPDRRAIRNSAHN